MKIVNEQLIISNLTNDQYKLYFQDKNHVQNENIAPNSSTATNSNNMPNSSTTIENSILENNLMTGLNDAQIQMVHQFSKDSHLNLEWSKQ